ncbi:putative methyltransferase At1g29790 [Nicotiana tabacum]|uniref:Methyltransferase At1g29790 n=3 Tax=Nicotiana TaxID=4085 RepID=A0AC58RLQ7_TOBAC|nr:PREDICTED: uncharacterized protein LOC104230427 [Nicotiana sylvestris]
MGSAEDDHLPKKQTHKSINGQTKYKLKLLFLIILTNLLTIYIFTGPSLNLHPILKNTINDSPFPAFGSTSLLQELSATKKELETSRSQIKVLHQQLKSTNQLVTELLAQLNLLNQSINRSTDSTLPNFNDLLDDLSNEAKLGLGPHKLPLGLSPRSRTDEVYPSVGGGCLMYKEDLAQYMTYNVGKECPVDDVFAQRLMLKGCEPLPIRRCHPKAPAGYVEPTPLPKSLWSTPPDTSIIWDPYTCKNYSCLIERRKFPGFYDCKDCFDLQFREKTRWQFDNGGLDFGMDQVLSTRSQGTIRIGLDIGGGVGTFAARMKERNVTIITTSMNLDGPFNSFIASRGLISMHVGVSQRLPFFQNTLDIVHSMHILSNWIPDTMLELIMYDIYRVLRPGGLFWLDHFFCLGTQLNATYVPMLERVGFKKLRWKAGMKLDRGIDKNEWYFSALLEKPMS